ncbi:MAG: DUF3108 domain-containing protein [Ignavibacteriae bacterium]|nr:DUF3108 domain-containing protein [Ignavibacteriota bacterium]MCB9215421.1 DUF3108 domain-containing protein [Ignavibacteria bacterium]
MFSFVKPGITGKLRKATTLAAILLVGMVGLTASTNERTGANEAALRTISNDAFSYGEKLTFAVKYKFITAGYAVMSVAPKPTTVSNRPCFDIKFTMRTTNSFDKIFKVRDTYRTWIDVDGLFPWKFQQQVREGDYKKDFSANIDQKEHLARTTKGSFKVSEYVQDVLSAFYYTRAYDIGSMKAGQSFSLKNFYDNKTHDLKVRVLGKETISVKAGKFRCIKVEPMVKEGGLFKSEGKITIWLTDDARKIPVKVSTKVAIGSIDSELVKYEGTKGTVDAKVN